MRLIFVLLCRRLNAELGIIVLSVCEPTHRRSVHRRVGNNSLLNLCRQGPWPVCKDPILIIRYSLLPETVKPFHYEERLQYASGYRRLKSKKARYQRLWYWCALPEGNCTISRPILSCHVHSPPNYASSDASFVVFLVRSNECGLSRIWRSEKKLELISSGVDILNGRYVAITLNIRGSGIPLPFLFYWYIWLCFAEFGRHVLSFR